MRKINIQKKFRIPLLLMMVGILFMLAGNAIPKEVEVMEKEPEILSGTLEEDIRRLICSVSGVKDACVVITYADSGEQIVEKDTTSQTGKTHEEDGAGGNRVVEEEEKQEETVYIEDAEGNRHPFVRTEKYKTVQGVAVVIRGTYDESIREKIVRMLEVLLNVPTHKVQVTW